MKHARSRQPPKHLSNKRRLALRAHFLFIRRTCPVYKAYSSPNQISSNPASQSGIRFEDIYEQLSHNRDKTATLRSNSTINRIFSSIADNTYEDLTYALLIRSIFNYLADLPTAKRY